MTLSLNDIAIRQHVEAALQATGRVDLAVAYWGKQALPKPLSSTWEKPTRVGCDLLTRIIHGGSCELAPAGVSLAAWL